MKRAVSKSPRVSICGTCRGTGKIENFTHPEGRMKCPQCEGSGRVIVSCEMMVDIRPYRDGDEL